MNLSSKMRPLRTNSQVVVTSGRAVPEEGHTIQILLAASPSETVDRRTNEKFDSERPSQAVDGTNKTP